MKCFSCLFYLTILSFAIDILKSSQHDVLIIWLIQTKNVSLGSWIQTEINIITNSVTVLNQYVILFSKKTFVLYKNQNVDWEREDVLEMVITFNGLL